MTSGDWASKSFGGGPPLSPTSSRPPRKARRVAPEATKRTVDAGKAQLFSEDLQTVRLRLSERQDRLLNELRAKSDRLADMYLGALTCQAHETLPDREALVAHGFRELLDHLPEYVGVVPGKKPLNLKQLVEKVVAVRKNRVRAALVTADPWTTADSAKIREFLVAFVAFEGEVEEVTQSRRDRQRPVIEALDPSPIATPEEAVSIFFTQWQELSGGFNGIAHHNPDPHPLDELIERCELFLLDYIIQKPIPRRQEILDLIREGSESA